ncbi:MAG: hypothetical protein P0116_10730 [Candidatus Nitrosocosmicus sp.]|nr:hypothetical protein [Candidatus Nitrosocosmicus sp.]
MAVSVKPCPNIPSNCEKEERGEEEEEEEEEEGEPPPLHQKAQQGAYLIENV